MIGKNFQFSWNDDRQNSFDKLKTALLNPPVLKLADTSRPFEVYTDASNLAIGAVLMQSDDQGNHPIAYASRKLRAAEKSYTSQKERRSLSSLLSSPGGCTCSNTSKYLPTIRQLSTFVQSFTCLNARHDGLNSWPILISPSSTSRATRILLIL